MIKRVKPLEWNPLYISILYIEERFIIENYTEETVNNSYLLKKHQS